MSESEVTARRKCVSCGINVAGLDAARFPCPQCGHQIFRCKRCRKQSTRYDCPECGFEGP